MASFAESPYPSSRSPRRSSTSPPGLPTTNSRASATRPGSGSTPSPRRSPTLSKLEERFLELLREAGLPLPITNKVAGTYRVDCRWPDHELIVELVGYRFHSSRH